MMDTTDATRLVTFQLADDLFAADIATVERVLRYEAPRFVPGLPAWIDGVIAFGEGVIPVVDLRQRLGLPEAPSAATSRLLVFGAGEHRVAARVDAVLDVRPLTPESVAAAEPFLSRIAARYVSGVCRRGAQLVIIIDVPKVFSATERSELAAAGTSAIHD